MTFEITIKQPWRELLVNVSDEEVEELWGQIEGQAAEFRN